MKRQHRRSIPRAWRLTRAGGAAAARHFRGRHIIWEIWNEPNISFWSPKPDANQYTALALAAAKAVRNAEPDATIIGPASSGFPWEFLETFLKSGILEYLDGVSVHPYREYRRGPETAAPDFEKLRQLIDHSLVRLVEATNLSLAANARGLLAIACPVGQPALAKSILPSPWAGRPEAGTAAQPKT